MKNYKLIFLVSPGELIEAERMWVKIKKIETAHYVGILDNDPVLVQKLSLGDEIEFEPRHIAGILY